MTIPNENKHHETSNFKSDPASKPRVLIIGGGIGGLTLAHGLVRRGYPVRVAERDSGTTFRSQGYRVRINEQGAAGIEACLSPDHFRLWERSCAVTKLHGAGALDPLTGEAVPGGIGGGRPGGPMPGSLIGRVYTVDRTVFRSVLLKDLENVMQWGKEFRSYRMLGDQSVQVEYEDGTSDEADVVIGADGTWSRVRQQLLENLRHVHDTAGRAIYGKTPLTPDLLAALNDTLHAGMGMVRDTRNKPDMSFLFLEAVRFSLNPHEVDPCLPNISDYMYWVFGFTGLGIEDATFFRMTSAEAADLTIRLTHDWHPSIRVLLEQQDRVQSAPLRIVSALPPLPQWTTGRVTLLGDAIHNMSPTGGSGANTALRDAGVLLNHLDAHPDEHVLKGIEAYEREMREYGAEMILASARGGQNMFNMPAPDTWKALELH